MSNSIKISVGKKLYEVVDEHGELIAKFEFLPTDIKLMERCDKLIDRLNEMKEEDEFGFLDFNERIKGEFDVLLGEGTSEGLFMTYDPLTVTADGSFFFEKIMDNIGLIVEKEMQSRMKKKKADIKKRAESAKKYD